MVSAEGGGGWVWEVATRGWARVLCFARDYFFDIIFSFLRLGNVSLGIGETGNVPMMLQTQRTPLFQPGLRLSLPRPVRYFARPAASSRKKNIHDDGETARESSGKDSSMAF